jgi:hypothetical protein
LQVADLQPHSLIAAEQQLEHGVPLSNAARYKRQGVRSACLRSD